MAVIWGLDLNELQWGKFKSSYMFKNRDYHLRRTKFIVYQAAMIFCVVSESLGTAVLSDYIDEQDYIEKANPNASLYNNDYVGMDSYNIFAGVFVAFIFGSAFFFDLFWPERHEIDGVRLAWRITSVLASVFMLASAITKTVIVSTRSAYIEGVDEAEAEKLLTMFPGSGTSPLEYRKNARAVASLVFAWIGAVFVIAGTVIMYMSLSYIERNGPFSAHANPQKKAMDAERNAEVTDEKLQGHTATNGAAPGAATESRNQEETLYAGT